MLNRIILFIGCILMLGCNSQQTKDDTLITVFELKEVLKTDNVQLIDVRTSQEFSAGHIESAVNINYFDNNFISDMMTLDKDKPVYLYCRSGNRSSKAARILKQRGFSKVYDLQGGFIAWERTNK